MEITQQTVDSALKAAALYYPNAGLIGNVSYGWHFKSAGRVINLASLGKKWLKIHLFTNSEKAQSYKNHIKDANSISQICKPLIEEEYEYMHNNYIVICFLMTWIKDEIYSSTPVFKESLPLPTQQWLEIYSQQLKHLNLHKTNYISYRQELITRRIHERFGNHIPTLLNNWGTIHGDLH